ncbi:hypothetical protein ACH4TQ_33255 [Streptomyces sp. NPDC021218]|uniref:hypothetical protein n=1 Tax=unclassified Streptomyces TaxID=2593676 RepID=UPI0036961A8F
MSLSLPWIFLQGAGHGVVDLVCLGDEAVDPARQVVQVVELLLCALVAVSALMETNAVHRAVVQAGDPDVLAFGLDI